MTSRVFVAGATGVLGRRVVPALLAAGCEVTANVRDDEARRAAEAAGARTATVDLFDLAATARLADDHDTVVNIATAIPTGTSAAFRRGWRTNDRIRSEASANLAGSMAASGRRYIGESTTFPYVDSGDAWVDETAACAYFWGNESCRDAEAAAHAVTEAGGVGVALRFAMFFAADSAHVEHIRALARRGLFALPGSANDIMSWIHVDDAAAAVVAAIRAPAGIYNVAESDPAPRGSHAVALARSVGRERLRVMPAGAVRIAGESIESLARAQRISSNRLTEATGWSADHDVVGMWHH
ncbi:MAG: NAD-dependent epimerase/dehydratase family protein [Ilumatobacter sp.]